MYARQMLQVVEAQARNETNTKTRLGDEHPFPFGILNKAKCTRDPVTKQRVLGEHEGFYWEQR